MLATGLLNLFLAIFLLTSVSEKAFSQDEVFSNPFSITSNDTHQIKLLNHGLASLEERLQMIERAEKTIDVEYYIYAVDKSSKIFNQALIKKARQGVKVRVLLDYFRVQFYFSPFYAHEMEKAGIEVKYFNTTSVLNVFQGQYRNHRKILIIDGKEVITGGRNIADEYFDLNSRFNFLDRDIKLVGNLTKAIKKTFDEGFNSKLSERLKRPDMPERYDSKYTSGDSDNIALYNQDLQAWNKKVDAAKSFIQDPPDQKTYDLIREKGQAQLAEEYSGTCEEMSFNSEYPTIGKKNRKEDRVIKHDFFYRIKNARKSVMIDTAYFVMNDELSSALREALSKKVDVKLLTNSLTSTDAIFIYATFDSNANYWLSKGLDANIFKGTKPSRYEILSRFAGDASYSVHAKTLIFDDEDVAIGTYNMDPRSANYNAEMVVTCEKNPELARVVQADIDERLVQSIQLNSKKAIKDAEFYQVGFGKRLLYYILKIPSNIFSYLL